jgi:hypothetical protein
VDSALACPPVDFIEAIHTATFDFEHGSSVDGQAALARARAISVGSPDFAVRGLLDSLGIVERSIHAEPNRARLELENLRVMFHDWACLPETLHQQFHAKLPPLP